VVLSVRHPKIIPKTKSNSNKLANGGEIKAVTMTPMNKA
jgi:hypothetical protein